MEPHRKILEEKYGQTRLLFSSNGSSLLFTSNIDCYTLDWTTKDPAIVALRTVLQRELAESQLGTTYILYGQPTQTIEEEPGTPELMQKFFDLTDAYESRPDDPANQIDFARFDFPTRAIMLADLEPDFTLTGMGYVIARTNGKSLDADAQAMRRAFLDTADESLIPVIDWATESLNS